MAAKRGRIITSFGQAFPGLSGGGFHIVIAGVSLTDTDVTRALLIDDDVTKASLNDEDVTNVTLREGVGIK